jgi:CDP-glucose 4,6-dehydratase
MISFWQDRPTLVTGATGLVGSCVTQGLRQRGAEVVCLVRDWLPSSPILRNSAFALARGDVRDQATLERVLGEYEIDTVIHLAAQTIVPIANRNPVSTFETNIKGTWSLLEACRRSPKVRQIVIASSDKAYGIAEELPYHEQTPLRGRYPYDVSKSCADLLAQAYATSYNLPVVITRCGNFFGGGDLNWNRLVPGTIRALLQGKRPVIRSDGRSVRDYLYVEDGAAAYLLLAEKLAEKPELCGRPFNFSTEMPLTSLELVQRIITLMGSGLTPEIRNEATNEIPNQCLQASQAREVLGWRPQFTLDDGLHRTLDWYTNYFSHSTMQRAA